MGASLISVPMAWVLGGPLQAGTQSWAVVAVLGLVSTGISDLLFSSGDLRSLLGIDAPLPFSAERFIAFDTALTVTSMLSIGLFARCMMRARSPLPIVLLLALGIGAKTLASATFFEP